MEEVFQRNFRRPFVIEHDIDYPLHLIVSGYCHHRHSGSESPWSVDGDEAIDRAFQKQPGIFVDEVGPMPVAGNEVEITFLQQMVFDPTHHRSRIAIADLGNDDANGEATLCAQGASEEIWPVFVFLYSGKNSVLGFLRDGICHAGSVNNQRYSGGSEPQTFGQFLEGHGFPAHSNLGRRLAFFLARHAAKSRTNELQEQAMLANRIAILLTSEAKEFLIHDCTAY